MRIYQRPVYQYDHEISVPPPAQSGDPTGRDNSLILLVYAGSRWLGTVYPNARIETKSRSWFETWAREYHAFWEDIYTNMTRFLSDPTTQSSIVGVDFYRLGERGERYGPFGQLFPMPRPKGSGFMKCVENRVEIFSWDVNYLDQTLRLDDDDAGAIMIDYELRKGREYEVDMLDTDCNASITSIGLNLTTSRSPKYDTHDILTLKYSVDKSQFGGGSIDFCQVVRAIIPGNISSPKKVLHEEENLIHQSILG